ncbi:MAG: S-layer homology domain-containing protein, partial [bacterium]|nr:S-layer homology domain-containing protein [bacterium]
TAGYISGYPDGTVRPDAPINRQEVAAMLTAIAKLEIPPDYSVLNGFRDAGEIPDWSKGVISSVVSNNLMNGYPDQTFQASKDISRAEAIVTLSNAISTQAPLTAENLYNKAGTFGPITGMENVNGNVIVSISGVTLQNLIITGDLILAKGIGDGEVTLQNITVKGDTLIMGGGSNSVSLANCTLPSITVARTKC